MFGLPTKVRSQLIDFAADVIEQHQSKMTDIDFQGLIYERELTPSDTRLADVLCNSGQTEIKSLNLGLNELWFKDATIRASLFTLVKSQS